MRLITRCSYCLSEVWGTYPGSTHNYHAKTVAYNIPFFVASQFPVDVSPSSHFASLFPTSRLPRHIENCSAPVPEHAIFPCAFYTSSE